MSAVFDPSLSSGDGWRAGRRNPTLFGDLDPKNVEEGDESRPWVPVILELSAVVIERGVTAGRLCGVIERPNAEELGTVSVVRGDEV